MRVRFGGIARKRGGKVEGGMAGRNAIACDLKSLGICYYIVVVGIIKD